MGQIIDRIFNIAKSYANDSDLSAANRIINSDEDNLKNIIDELNKKEEPKKETFNYAKDSNSNRSNSDEKISNDKAYQILGLNFNCSVDEIKSAYKEKIKEYHPDKVQNLGQEIKDLAVRKTKELNSAYSLLRQIRNF